MKRRLYNFFYCGSYQYLATIALNIAYTYYCITFVTQFIIYGHRSFIFLERIKTISVIPVAIVSLVLLLLLTPLMTLYLYSWWLQSSVWFVCLFTKIYPHTSVQVMLTRLERPDSC